MNKLLLVAACLVLCACSRAPADAGADPALVKGAPALQCGKDTDCKGDRICEGGRCMSPADLAPVADGVPAVAAPAPAPPVVPQFKDYPAAPRYDGPPAGLLLDSDFARDFRTRLTEAMAGAPVFAGEYVVAGWGCGSSGCYVQSLVNRRTGQAIEPSFGAYSVMLDPEAGTELRVGEEIDSMRLDSRLLVTREVTEEDAGQPRRHFANFYLVEDGDLTLLKKIEVPAPPHK